MAKSPVDPEEYRLLVTHGKETLVNFQIKPVQIGLIGKLITTLFGKKNTTAVKKPLDK